MSCGDTLARKRRIQSAFVLEAEVEGKRADPRDQGRVLQLEEVSRVVVGSWNLD